MKIKLYYLSILILILNFLLPLVSVSQTLPNNNLQPPEDINQLKEETQKTGKVFIQKIPEATKEVWNREAIPIWEKMWDSIKNIWNKFLGNFLKDIWYNKTKPLIEKTINKILRIAGKKVEENKPKIQKEFQKKKEETTKEIEKQAPQITETIWQKLREILR